MLFLPIGHLNRGWHSHGTGGALEPESPYGKKLSAKLLDDGEIHLLSEVIKKWGIFVIAVVTLTNLSFKQGPR